MTKLRHHFTQIQSQSWNIFENHNLRPSAVSPLNAHCVCTIEQLIFCCCFTCARTLAQNRWQEFIITTHSWLNLIIMYCFFLGCSFFLFIRLVFRFFWCSWPWFVWTWMIQKILASLHKYIQPLPYWFFSNVQVHIISCSTTTYDFQPLKMMYGLSI